MKNTNDYNLMKYEGTKVTIKSSIFNVRLMKYDYKRTWIFQPNGKVTYYMDKNGWKGHFEQLKFSYDTEQYVKMMIDLEKCLRNLDSSLYAMTLDDTTTNITIEYDNGLKIEAPAYMGSADGTLLEIVKKYYPELDF